MQTQHPAVSSFRIRIPEIRLAYYGQREADLISYYKKYGQFPRSTSPNPDTWIWCEPDHVRNLTNGGLR